MQLVKSEPFGTVMCDIYRDENDFYMTREQIGRALEYSNPQKALDNMHSNHHERLDKFSVTLDVRATDGKVYKTTAYNRKGIMEICRWSQQPKADAFIDWVWSVMDGLMSGEIAIVPKPMTAAEILAAQSQILVDMERRQLEADARAAETESRVATIEQKTTAQGQALAAAMSALSLPVVSPDDWCSGMNRAISPMCIELSVSQSVFRGQLYAELEDTARCNLTSRQTRQRNRMKAVGSTATERKAVTKLVIISNDAKLRPVFEAIVRKYQAQRVVRVWDMAVSGRAI